MNDIKIPKSFTLFGRKMKVKMCNNLVVDNDHVGESKFRVEEIRVQVSDKVYPRTKDQTTQTYFHELTHIIIDEIEYSFNTPDEEEKFVRLFSKLLYQALKTAVY